MFGIDITHIDLGDWKKYKDIATLIIVLLGAFVGLRQYVKTQQWKKMEYAVSLIEKFYGDIDCRLAITLLDWRSLELQIPDRFKHLSKENETFIHSYRAMATAFSYSIRERIVETGSYDLRPEFITVTNVVYIDVFDRFFKSFENLSTFIKTGLIRKEDLEPLVFWADRVCNFEFNGSLVFHEYLVKNEFDGIYKLSTSGSIKNINKMQTKKAKTNGDWVFFNISEEIEIRYKVKRKLATITTPYQLIELYDTFSYAKSLFTDKKPQSEINDNFIYNV